MKGEPSFNLEVVPNVFCLPVVRKSHDGGAGERSGKDAGAAMDEPRSAAEDAGNPEKTPRTERGRRTLRKLLDAAAIEFGERGFHDASISDITRRASPVA